MSFIYDDKNLLNKLLKSALEHEKKFSKQGQVIPPANLDPAYTQQTDNFNSLLQLIDNLETRISNPNAMPEISHAGAVGAHATMSSADLVNLGSFVQFVAGNGISVDGRRIAYIVSSEQPTAPDESYVQFKLEPGPGAITNPNRNGQEQGFFINRDLLSAYIQSLLAKLVNNPNQVTSLMLKHIVEQSNSLLGTKINFSSKNTAEQPTGASNSNSTQTENANSGGQTDIQHAIGTVLSLLPFDNEFIDFERINEFLTAYMRFVQLTQRGDQIFTAIQSAQNAIGSATNMTQNNDTRISIRSNYSDIAHMLKPPFGTNYTTFINLMQNALQATYTVISDLYANWIRDPGKHRELVISPEQKQSVEEQILGDNSYYRRNVIVLNEWLGNRDKVMKFV